MDQCRCRVTTLVQANFGVLPDLNQQGDRTNDVSDLMNGLAITEGPLDPRHFPRLPDAMTKHLHALPIPHMPLFSDYARRIQTVFNRVIDDAIMIAQESS